MLVDQFCIWNTNLLGPGEHTAVAYADGEVLGSTTFTVTELAENEWFQGIASLKPSQQRMVAVAAHHKQLHHHSVQTIINAQL